MTVKYECAGTGDCPHCWENYTQWRKSQRTIGDPRYNFWRWDPKEGYDLTHPPTVTSRPTAPRIKLKTANQPITIDPRKTVLMIVDMQNLWLSQGTPTTNPGLAAEECLIKTGIPAARKAGIQIIWLNWGLSLHDLKTLSPTVFRIFGCNTDGSPSKTKGIGMDMGQIALPNGSRVAGGKLLMRGEWNMDLHEPLQRVAEPTDRLFYKNRISGMCDTMTECTDYLTTNHFTTILFAGVNTDICVLATLQDANLKGFDTILLKDGCGTTNGDEARIATERSCKRAWGFLSSCIDLHKGVETMIR